MSFYILFAVNFESPTLADVGRVVNEGGVYSP